MASVSKESIGELYDKITVKIEKQDYLPLYEKDIKSISKKANIPGFRKGMVPSGLIKKMYGKEVYADTVSKLAEKELKDFIINEKLNLLGQPLYFNEGENIPKLDFQNPQDYEFLFEVGLRPDLQIDIPKDAKAIFYKVKVKPEDIDNRVDAIQAQFGELKDAEIIEGPDNIVYGEFTELNEDGTEKEEGFKGDTSLYVKVFNEEFQQQLTGKKNDDILTGTFSKMVDAEKYPGFYQNLKIDKDNNALVNAPVQLKISGVNNLEKAPLDEELYKKAFPARQITTEEEFRKAIEEDEQSLWDKSANDYLEHTIIHILGSIPVKLPEDFLKKTISESSSEKPSEEDAEKSLQNLITRLKWSIISEKIISGQQLNVTTEEIRNDVTDELKNYFGRSTPNEKDNEWANSFADRVLADRKQTEQRAEKLLSKKILNWAKTQINIQEQDISQEDFQKEMEHHQHTH